MNTENEIKCKGCKFAECSAGTLIPLKNMEVGFMRYSGTALQQMLPPAEISTLVAFISPDKAEEPEIITLEAEYGLYRMESDCGNAIVDMNGMPACAAINNPLRPEVCREADKEGTSNIIFERATY